MDIKTTACIPTMPSRLSVIEQSALSIASQVDQLFIYCNNNVQLPNSLLETKNIFPVSNGDYGSVGRFFISMMEGYLFFCDDDLLYPEHYCDYLITKIEEYERKAVIGYHGRIIKVPLKSYYGQDSEVVYPCRLDLNSDHEVNFIGTGCMSYHSSTLKVLMDSFKHNNMDDAEFSIKCAENNVPMFVVAHQGLEYLNPIGTTIYDETMKDQRPLLDLINSFKDWKTFTNI